MKATDHASPSPSPAFKTPGVSVSPTWTSASVMSLEISLPSSLASPALRASGSASSESSNSSSLVASSSFIGAAWSSVSSAGVVSSLFSVVESLTESSRLVVSFTSAGFSVELIGLLFSSKV